MTQVLEPGESREQRQRHRQAAKQSKVAVVFLQAPVARSVRDRYSHLGCDRLPCRIVVTGGYGHPQRGFNCPRNPRHGRIG